jgi:hypothetical protein
MRILVRDRDSKRWQFAGAVRVIDVFGMDTTTAITVGLQSGMGVNECGTNKRIADGGEFVYAWVIR